MASCWSADSHQRPKFEGLLCNISDLLEVDAGYLELSCSINWKDKEPLDLSTAAASLLTSDRANEEEEASAN